MDTYANSYQAYGNIVGPPISRSGSAFGGTSYRSGNTRHGCGIITAHPPGIERTASVAGSICDVGTELCSPSGMYDLPSPDLPPSWPAAPSYNASTAAHHTGDYPISVSFPPSAHVTQASTIDFASCYPSSTREAYSSEYRIDPQLMAYHPGGKFILPEPPTSSTQVSQAPVSPPGGGKPSLAGNDSCLETGERASWEPVQYVEPRRSDLVHSASSDSSRSAPSSSYRSSHSDRIKKSQQNPTNFFERLQTTRQGLLSRFTGVTASVSGTTHNLKDLYRRFTKY